MQKKDKKHDLYVILMENQVFVDPARYYATQRHNPRSEFYKNGLKPSARIGEKKSSFIAKKMSTSGDITKNVGVGADSAHGSFRVKILKRWCILCVSFLSVVCLLYTKVLGEQTSIRYLSKQKVKQVTYFSRYVVALSAFLC